MEFYSLFVLIHSLSAEEKRNFTKYVGDKGESEAMLLYKRISRIREFEEGIKSRVIGKEFSDSKKFYSYRTKLAKLIWESLVANDESANKFFSFVKRAFLDGAPKIAQNRLFHEMRRLNAEEDFVCLSHTYHFISKLYSDYQIRIDVPTEISTADEVLEHLHDLEVFEQIFDLVRTSTNLSFEEKDSIYQHQIKRLKTKYTSKKSQVLRIRSLIYLELLCDRYEKAFEIAESYFIKLDEEKDLFTPYFIAHETSIVAINAIRLGYRTQATKLALKIGTIQAYNLLEKTKIKQLRIQVGVALAATFAEESVATMYYQELGEAPFPKLKTAREAIQYHFIALTFFYNEKWIRVIECALDLKGKAPKSLFTFQWELRLMLAIAYSEAEMIEDAMLLLRSASRYASSSNQQYPKMAVKTFGRYLNSTPLEQLSVLRKGLTAIQDLISHPDEERSTFGFPIQIWIKSKILGTPQKKIIQDSIEEKEQRQMKIYFG